MIATLRKRAFWLSLLFVIATRAFAQTADVELRPGYVDPASGIKVEEIVVLPEQDMQAVRLAIPRGDAAVEEMVVTARRRSGETVLQLKPHEFVRDYEHGYYGLVIYLGRNESKPLRLYLDAAQHRPGAITP